MTIEDALWHIRNVYTNLAQKDSQAAEPYGIAIKALEKQIALKPQKIECAVGVHILCPQCNHRFYISINGKKNIWRHTAYCERCGQRIDWEEEKNDAEIH